MYGCMDVWVHGCVCVFVFSPRAVEESLNENWFNTHLGMGAWYSSYGLYILMHGCMGVWLHGCLGVWVLGGCMSVCGCVYLVPFLVCVCVCMCVSGSLPCMCMCMCEGVCMCLYECVWVYVCVWVCMCV